MLIANQFDSLSSKELNKVMFNAVALGRVFITGLWSFFN